MARPKNSALVQRYREQIELSKRWRNKTELDASWRRFIDLYRGRPYNSASDSDRMLINMALSTINVIVPSLAVSNPKFTVEPRSVDDAPAAIVTERLLNYVWETGKFQPQFKRAVKDSRIIGHGWVKVTYKFVQEGQTEPKIVEDADGEVGVSGDYETDETVPENVSTTNMVVKEDRPVVERVSPFDIFVDPDAKHISEVRWIAQRIRRPLADVKKDKRYKASVRNNLDATDSKLANKWATETSEDEVQDTTYKYVDVWEFYDVARCAVSTFTEVGDDFLIAPKRIPFKAGHPFVMVPCYEVPEEFYPIGDLEAIEGLQLELNETRTQMMNHRKKYARKILYRPDAFSDPNALNNLQSDEDNLLVAVTGDEPFDQVISPLRAEMVPPEFYNQSSLIQGDIDRVSGVSDYQRGGMPEIRRTATEAGIMADASNARTADALATIETCLAEVGERIIGLQQEFMTGEQVLRVTGVDGVFTFLTFDRDYIDGAFDFKVVAGSTQPNNESFRRQSALQMMDAIAPLAGAGVINMVELARHVLEEGFGVKDANRFVIDPMAMQAQQPQIDPMTGQPIQQPIPPQGGPVPAM